MIPHTIHERSNIIWMVIGVNLLLPVTKARHEGTYQKLIKKLDKKDLLILDDFGLQPLTPEARLALLTLLEDRYEEKSVIITSQLPLDRWYDYIAEPTLADAIMDRLINSSEPHRAQR